MDYVTINIIPAAICLHDIVNLIIIIYITIATIKQPATLAY